MMACLEHECHSCGYWWTDNNASRVCPRCHSLNTSLFFDEFPESEEKDDDREEECSDDERG